MKTIKTTLGLIAGLMLITSCGGLAGISSTGSESASATTRTVTGSLDSGASANLFTAFTREALAAACDADAIVATDTDGNASSHAIDEACAFSIDLQIGKSYAISFASEDIFVASLIFDTGIEGYSGSSFEVTEGSDVVNLGTITLTGSIATPENSPLDYMDRDGDGECDLKDHDDDDDGRYDHEDWDCDLNGRIDDEDDDCLYEDFSEQVVRVKPHDEAEDVDLEKQVRIYTSCPIAANTVTADNIVVEAEDGTIVECTLQQSDFRYHHIIKCLHDDVDFETDSEYSVSVSGLECQDGTALEDVEWSFSTEAEDHDEGCAEDDFDEEDELDDEDDDEEDDDEDDEEDDLEDDDDDDEDDDGLEA